MSDAAQWVSVLDRMPRHIGEYLTLNEEGFVRVNWWDGEPRWLDKSRECERVLMWRNMPAAPPGEQVAQPILDELDRRDEEEECEEDDDCDDDFDDEDFDEEDDD